MGRGDSWGAGSDTNHTRPGAIYAATDLGFLFLVADVVAVKFPVLSHTLLNDFENCPFKMYRKYILKDLPRQPQTEAMRWGNEVHTAFEVRIKHGTKWPAGMEKYEAIAAPLVAAGALAEKMMGITETGALCDFFAKDVWLRGKIDSTVIRGATAAIWDWKTGKRRDDPVELHTHAVLLKAWQPTVTRITAHFVWLQENEVGKAFDVSDTATHLRSIQHQAEDIKRCMEVEDFPKRRNPLCDYCPVVDCENRGNWKRGR